MRVTEWNGMVSRETQVKVAGLRGMFTFIAAYVDGDRCDHVQVIGGTANHRLMRAFEPDRIVVPKGRR